MSEYPDNSRTTKKAPVEDSDEKKIEPIVSEGAVTRRKRPLGKRLTETFIGGSDAQSVWEFVGRDVLVPAIKDMVTAAVTEGVERLVFGESRGGHRGRSRASSISRGGDSGYTSYNRYSTSPARPERREDPRRDLSRRGRAQHDFDEIILPTRAAVMEVLEGLFDLIDEYGVAKVSDLYALLNTTAEFTDEKYGWTDIRGARPVRVRGGFLLDIARPVELD